MEKDWKQILREKYPKGVHTNFSLGGQDWVGDADQVPWIETFISYILTKAPEETSDGYHTFKELYEFRKLYNAALFNEWANGHKEGFAVKYNVHKSKKHHTGEECFGGGWFIVVAELPTGQISNHYELKDWDLFNIPEKEKGDKWDGHTPQNVMERLYKLLSPTKNDI